ncbi:ABC-type proline/glycine betaine transport systems permease component [Rubrobacter radiotolerans]|uniref:ABC transporter permease n=1 Tax=Rubrobacter radiotolerans TaxID=42256 RepID=A0A023X4F7_RUBRA|nr:ABC transporter permease [Rubrobacter radiotolerans]AHY47362.1 ABC-type proline/glycine betaine transport systems permease component [Rubrobacter radiotolerans]MDX5894766.1 ABC transporter permease [Rubrobacter radiotolerans]SMC06725.1 osmoprotectant transport system permease protein [Rubrobacter radiotolerans DSM 5868]
MSFPEYVLSRWDNLLEDAIAHAQVVLAALLIATAIGVGLGILTYRRPVAAQAVLAISSAVLTIPSFALFTLVGAIFPFLGLGFLPTMVVLAAYAVLAILRNTITGLQSVDPAISESAMGMGYSRWQRLVKIELPLAWPVIIAGIRVSGLLILGIAAIAAYVNGPGLGGDIFSGLSRIGGANSVNLVLGGFLGIIVLALVFELFFAILNKLTISKGLN